MVSDCLPSDRFRSRAAVLLRFFYLFIFLLFSSPPPSAGAVKPRKPWRWMAEAGQHLLSFVKHHERDASRGHDAVIRLRHVQERGAAHRLSHTFVRFTRTAHIRFPRSLLKPLHLRRSHSLSFQQFFCFCFWSFSNKQQLSAVCLLVGRGVWGRAWGGTEGGQGERDSIG